MGGCAEWLCGGFLHYLGSPICRAAGAEALAAKHGPPRLRFERHAIGFPALIANDLKPLAFRSSCSSSGTLARAAKVGAARVAAGFATLGMAQAALAIVVLLSFSKRESGSAFGASNL